MGLYGTPSPSASSTAANRRSPHAGCRTELLRGHPFLDAYLRAVIGIVAAATLYGGLIAWWAEDFFFTAFVYAYQPSTWVVHGSEESLGEYLAMVDPHATVPRMVVQAATTALSWPPVVALLLGAGALSLALEHRDRS